MRKASRIVSLFLSVLFILCGCTSVAPEIVPEYKTTVSSSVDLDGYVAKWGFASDGGTVFGFIEGSALADEALARVSAIQDSINCVIEMEYNSAGTINSNMQASVMSGSQLYELTTNATATILGSIRAGYFTGLSGLLDVKNTDKWGTPNMLQSAIYKDDVYGVVPYAWPELLYTTYGSPIAVNEDLILKYGHEDPREYVETGTWTWDKFEECLLAYTVKDGERTVYGVTSNYAYFAMLMFLSNGVTFVEYTDNGIECGLYTPQGIEAMERARKIRQETCAHCFAPTEVIQEVVPEFMAENAVLGVVNSGNIIGSISSFMYSMNNVGILPFPYGPSAEPGVYRSYHESLTFVTGIPSNAYEAESAAIILDLMFEPFDSYKTKQDIINYYSDQVFFDEQDAYVFANMLENTEYGYFNDGARAALDTVLKSNSVTEVLESLEDTYAELLEDVFKPHYEGRIAVYGE